MTTTPLPVSTSSSSTGLDLSGLTDDDTFESEATWLNEILSSDPSSGNTDPTSLASLDSSLARTLALLEVATADTSALVDRTIDDISRGVPRLTFDLQLMRENALLLRSTLDAIRKRASGTGLSEDSQVSKVMERLRVLDLVKARMEAARDVLREAESWSTLESEVTQLVGEQAYAKAAERLEEASRSMVVFQNTAEFEGRRALMVSLQNQLEASLSASLVAAINGRDVKACKNYYAIFSQIQREAEFTAYYFGSRRAKLVESWTDASLDDCGERKINSEGYNGNPGDANGGARLSQFLVKFYADLHSLLNEERTYVPVIFPSPFPTLTAFIITTLEGLTPTLPHRLSAISTYHGSRVLPELILAYRATEDFAVMVDRIMSKLGDSQSTSSTPLPPQTPSKRDRRLSKRMSTSKRFGSRSISFGSGSGPHLMGISNGGEEEALRPWETAIFEPFLDWQVEYPSLERSFLAAEIARETEGNDLMAYLVGSSRDDGAERALWEHTVNVFGFADDAITRNLQLTHGFGAAGMVEVLDGQLVSYFDQRRSELMRVRKGAPTRSRKGQPQYSTEEEEEEAALEGLEYSSEDWGTFQSGLRLLGRCRTITELLTTFDGKLRSRLTTLAHTMQEARRDPSYTIPGTTRGAVTMLRQSGLNSIELAELLEPLEKAADGGAFPSKAQSVPKDLLPKARGATTEFTRATQLFLHDTILAPLLAHLADYATLPVWSTATEQRPAGVAIPTFSLSPTETISRVGEGLFNLPRLFEVYANDDALTFSITTLPFVDAESLRALHGDLSSPLGAPPTTPRMHSHRLSATTLPTPPPLPDLTPETVISTWLSSLTLSLLSHLTTTILPTFSRLSRHGAAQLASDLSYISNVARALDVESPEELEYWREALEAEDGARREGEGGEKEKAVFDRVSRIRGRRG
ncbi:conserved oligomeric Golgi complex subunit 7, partial [Phenoliferia sp. Uapishka_3]